MPQTDIPVTTEKYRGMTIDYGVRGGEEWATARTEQGGFIRSISGPNALAIMRKVLDDIIAGNGK